MKRWGVLALALVMSFALIGCSGGPARNAEATVTEALNVFKTGDLTKFIGYYADDTQGDEVPSAEEFAKELNVDVETAERFLRAWCEQVEFSIKSAKESGNTATVEVEISAVDFTKLMEVTEAKLQEDVMADMAKFEAMSEDEIVALVFDMAIEGFATAEKSEPAVVTTKLIVQGSEWKIHDESLIPGLFPGL